MNDPLSRAHSTLDFRFKCNRRDCPLSHVPRLVCVSFSRWYSENWDQLTNQGISGSSVPSSVLSKWEVVQKNVFLIENEGAEAKEERGRRRGNTRPESEEGKSSRCFISPCLATWWFCMGASILAPPQSGKCSHSRFPEGETGTQGAGGHTTGTWQLQHFPV